MEAGSDMERAPAHVAGAIGVKRRYATTSSQAGLNSVAFGSV